VPAGLLRGQPAGQVILLAGGGIRNLAQFEIVTSLPTWLACGMIGRSIMAM
jgi:hypothetical protein